MDLPSGVFKESELFDGQTLSSDHRSSKRRELQVRLDTFLQDIATVTAKIRVISEFRVLTLKLKKLKLNNGFHANQSSGSFGGTSPF